MADYRFLEVITNKKNFIKRYIAWASTLTDAPYEYHEAFAISLLGIASHGLLLFSTSNPGGQALNTYFLVHGSSAISRKSTCMNIALGVLDDALQGAYGQSDDFTPEGLMDALERKDGLPMVVYMDEFTTMLDRLIKQSMAGLKPLILKFLNKRYHVYTRTSKGTVKKKQVDEVVIKNAHLHIMGNITPTITQRITDHDIDDGFLGRFIIVSPKGKPEPKRSTAMSKAQLKQRADLVLQLSEIAQACQNCRENAANTVGPTILIDPKASDLLWEYQKKIEIMEEKNKVTASQFIVIQRIPEYAQKFACLIALGEYDCTSLSNGPLIVGVDDVKLAIALANKYKTYAINFASHVGVDYQDQKIQKIIQYLKYQPGQKMSKRAVCKNMHINSKDAKELEATFLLQGTVDIVPVKSDNSHKPTIHWALSNGQPKSPAPEPSPHGGQTKGMSKGTGNS